MELAMKTASALTVAILLLLSAATFAQTMPVQRIRGDIVALDGQNLQVKSRSGAMFAIKLADNYAVNAVVPIDLDKIASGTFVGVASLPQPDGTEKALEVLLFPESRRGTGEGHYPWDLQAGSMMTNGTVATVTTIDQGRRMTLKYKDGEKTVVVPPGAPVVTFEPGDRAMLVPGAHVFVAATPNTDGTLRAGGVAVGKNGIVPPM
jgi:hypothetical protein